MPTEIIAEVDEDLIDLAASYIAKKQTEIEQVKNWAQDKNEVQLKSWSHKVKGTSASYGINVLASHAIEIEKLLAHSNWDQIKLIVEQIERDISNIKLKAIPVN